LKIRSFKNELEKLQAQISTKEAEHEALAQETAQLWGGLGENSHKIRDVEMQIESHLKRLAFLRSEYTNDKTALRQNSGRLKNLNIRNERFNSNLAEIETSLIELDKVQKDQKIQLKNLEYTIERKTVQKETVGKEITDAEESPTPLKRR